MTLTIKQRAEELRSVRDLLLLAGRKVSFVTLRQWSGWEVEKAGDWAAMVHCAASDNSVTIPPIPRCVRALPEVTR